MDPLVDLIRLLKPAATLWKSIAATGRWAVSFPQRDDLLFCSVVSGECQILRPAQSRIHLNQGDFALIRTTTPFCFASDQAAKRTRSEDAFSNASGETIRVGQGNSRLVLLQGGKFLFDTANEQLLLPILPAIILIRSSASSSSRIRTLLALNAEESLQPLPGKEFVVSRLMEVILVELLRTCMNEKTDNPPSLLCGLADPVVASALRSMHEQVIRKWTVRELAKVSGASRSSFAARFQQAVGLGPIEYLSQWRIALARHALRQPNSSVSEVAFAVGFQSASAFSTAFKRATGESPQAFAHRRPPSSLDALGYQE